MDKKAYFDKTCWKRLVDRLSNQTFCLHLLIEVTSNVNPLEADEESLRGIELDLHDFCEAVQLTGANRYQIVKKAIKKIIETAIDFKEDRRWRAIPFFNPKETSIIDKSRMSITINSEFIPYLADLKKFLVIKKDDICLSNRCLIFFTYLKTDCFNSTIKKPWEEVQSACGVCYDNYHDFKRKFLVPVLKEMLGKKIKVTYEAHKTGSKVNTLSFTVKDLREELVVQEEKKEEKPKVITDQVKEVFDLFNEELVKVFGVKRKIQSLNPETREGKARIKAIKELLAANVDLRTAFKGFFLSRKEMDNYYLDIPYVCKHLQVYLNYESKQKPKAANGHVTPVFRNSGEVEAMLRYNRQKHEETQKEPEFNVMRELGYGN